jgi:YidC/Oxa1 family membrane protein insertase
MDKNLLFAVLLTTVVILFFSSPLYQKRFGKESVPPATEQAADSTISREMAKSPSDTAHAPIPAAPTSPVADASISTPRPDSSASAIAQINPPAERELTLENEGLLLKLSTRGGVVTNAVMKKYLGPSSEQKAELVVPGKVWCDGSVTTGGVNVSFNSIVFAADTTTAGTVSLTAELTGGLMLKRTYTLSQKGYSLASNLSLDGPWIDPKITYVVHGAMNETEPEYRQLRIWPFSMMNPDIRMYEKIVYLGQGDRLTDENGKQRNKRIYSKEGAQNILVKVGGRGSDFFTGDLDWYAIKNKYFVAAIIPEENKRWKTAATFERDQNGNYFDFAITKPISDGSVNFTLYAGPIEYETLKTLGYNLTQVMELSWRWLRPLAILFLWIFRKLNLFISNWGLILIIFSIIIKVVLYPLSKKSTDSMKKMAALQPQVSALKEKYKNEPQRLQKATMELYKQEGVNPFGGCLPMLLQMPVLFALYPVIGGAFELRQAMFIPHWIEDLSRPDPFYILPIIMGVSMYFQSRTTMKDPNQKMMLYMMPVLMVVFFANMSAGLTLYWLMFNILSLAQQELIK